jgi:putative transcriptional regulator
MTIRHHPAEATLLAYGAGTLGEGPALVVATHIALCAVCRRDLAGIEALGGVLLDELPPAEMAPDCFAQLLGRLGEPEVPPPCRPVHAGVPTPEPLRTRLGGGIDEQRWRRVAPGIALVEVMPRTRAGGNVLLLRVAPGLSIARHGHRGSELTVILDGAYADELGSFGAGDFCEADEGITHRPVADTHGDCICLISTEAPLRFTGWAGRLIQPLLGI